MDELSRCHNCRFYDEAMPRENDRHGFGKCRRYAPRPGDVNEDGDAEWPDVQSTDYCGEHEYK